MSSEVQTKWYQNRILLLGIAIVLIAAVPFGYGFLYAQGVTPEQLLILEQQMPEIAEAIKAIQEGQSVWQVLIGLTGTLVAVFASWFNNSGTKELPKDAK